MSNVKLSELPAAVNIDDTDLVYGVVSGQSVSIPAELLLSRAGTLALSATGANVITASTNGVERMRITSAGNVGIGTSSPSSALTVQGTITGTAVTQSPTDTTSGRLMQVGDFGLGGFGIGLPNQAALDDITVGGFYRMDFTIANIANTDSMVLHIPARNGTGAAQILSRESNGDLFHRYKPRGESWSSWRELYHTDSILGTVSQSSGVPTGAIIERGSNSNGEFVRLADGTQICTRLLTINSSDFETSSLRGELWRIQTPQANYPAVFETSVRAHNAIDFIGSSSPIVRNSIVCCTARHGSETGSSTSWSKPTLWLAGSTFDPTGDEPFTVTVSLIAIGRW